MVSSLAAWLCRHAPRRQHLVLMHRWNGLVIALFLLVASITGSLLVFEDELELWLAPELHLAQPAAGQSATALLDPYQLRQRVAQALAPRAQLNQLMLHPRPGRTVRFLVEPAMDPANGRPYVLGYDEIWVNPYTGAIQGRRDRQKISLKPAELMPFIFNLHHSLALPRVAGALLMGTVATLWTLDCLVGLILTWPRARPFLVKWKPAWLIKWQAGFYRVNLDLHRACALWLWVVLLLLAWSSVMFNLRDQIYLPVMSRLLPFDTSWRGPARLPQPMAQPPMDWPQAHAMARQAMAGFARERGLRIDFEDRLSFDRRRGLYAYMVHSNADLRSDAGNTGLLIDARSGQILGHWLPTGDRSGNTFSNWIGALHMGQVWGLPWRIFLAALGLVVSLLTVTGIVIWWKKRCARKPRTKKDPVP
ncbi:PepSY-associated TM helix domain-containing protein [Herbaspirillum rubrisubalbicans]|nr:PepSY-associated TM helix domain-containing protein [Herbaspirillum rubrisubalbicans]